MNKVPVTKLVSDKLKTKQAKAQGTGGTYDGSYGAEPGGKVDPSKDIPENKQETSVVEPSGMPEKAATSVVEPDTMPEKAEVDDQKTDEGCVCVHCGGTGKSAKKAESDPEIKAEEAPAEKKEQGSTGTYDGSYGKTDDSMEGSEDETPAKKAKRIQDMPLSKISLDQIFNRVNTNTQLPSKNQLKMQAMTSEALNIGLQDFVSSFKK
jgi:hypothetical protein